MKAGDGDVIGELFVGEVSSTNTIVYTAAVYLWCRFGELRNDSVLNTHGNK